MNIFEEMRIGVWYKLRRRSRDRKNLIVKEIFREALARCKPDDICIDCGANVGEITSLLARTGATVHAFEPDPDAFRELEQRCAGLKNVILHKAAVSTSSGQVPLYRGVRSKSGVSEGSSIVFDKINVAHNGDTYVAAVNFVDFINQWSHVAILKMDIEGAEIDVLNALLDNNLTNVVGEIFVETHEKQIPSRRRDTMQLVRRCRPYKNIHLDWW